MGAAKHTHSIMEKDYVKVILRNDIKGDKEVTLPRYFKVKKGGALEYVRIKGALACYLFPTTAFLGTIIASSLTPYEAEHAVPVPREEWEAQVNAALKKQHDLYVL